MRPKNIVCILISSDSMLSNPWQSQMSNLRSEWKSEFFLLIIQSWMFVCLLWVLPWHYNDLNALKLFTMTALLVWEEDLYEDWTSVLLYNRCWWIQVGATVLSNALARIQQNSDLPEVQLGMSALDDAALTKPPPPGYLLVQTVDFFRTMINDAFRFGAISANHALSVRLAPLTASTKASPANLFYQECLWSTPTFYLTAILCTKSELHGLINGLINGSQPCLIHHYCCQK